MVWRGARERGVDYFDDIMGENVDHGMFTGMGSADHDRVQQKISKGGVSILMNCRFCGKRAEVEIPWEELFYVGANGPGKPLVTPEGWFKSDTNLDLYTLMRCEYGKCGGERGYAPHFTPDEARSLVGQAVASGFISQQQLAQWNHKLRMYQGAAG